MRIANRPGSIAPGTVRDYELATGVTVDYYEDVTDDPSWLASVAPTLARRDDIGTDLDILGDATVGQLSPPDGSRAWTTPTSPTGSTCAASWRRRASTRTGAAACPGPRAWLAWPTTRR